MIYKYSGCRSLETLYFKGEVPKMYNGGAVQTACVIKVPSEYLQAYKDPLGENLSNVLKPQDMKP